MSEPRHVGITGAAGYIGPLVASRLLDAGHDLTLVDNFDAPKVGRAVRGVEIREVDVRDRDALRETFDGIDAMIHLAAISGVPDCDERPEDAFDVNVGGTENAAWLCREWGVPLIFPCSMAMIGTPESFPITADTPRRPINHYGRVKMMSEDDVHALADGAFPAYVFMKSNLYGEYDLDGEAIGKPTVINAFVDMALSGGPITVHEPGTQARDFVHVEDVARAYELALDALFDADDGARTLPLASGESMSVLELARTIRDIVEAERDGAPEVTLVENPRGSETMADAFDVATAPAREAIGFEPEHTVERAVREMVR